MIRYETGEIIVELFTKTSKMVRIKNEMIQICFDTVDLLYYKLHKVSLNRSGSYIDSPICFNNWFKL